MYEDCTHATAHVKVHIEHTFAGISLADYETLYFDEDFNDALGRALRLGRKLLHIERTSERVLRRVCYEPDRDPELQIDRAWGSTTASFIEELDYDTRTHIGAWKTIPNRFADRVTNAGTIELAGVPGGTRRTVRGEVIVKLFGFGRIIERMIASEIEKSYVATTKFTNEWLRR